MIRFAVPASLVAHLALAQTSPLTHYRRAAASLAETNATVAQAQKKFASCRSGKLQLAFTSTLPSIEGARRAFEKRRRQAESNRQALEATRLRLEEARKAKHGSAEEREASEQHYATRYAADYELPMESIAEAIDDYRSGMIEYAALVSRYAEFCQTKGITDASAHGFVTSLSADVSKLLEHAEGAKVRSTQTSTPDVSTR